MQIGGVEFTIRELDIISCILNSRGTKKIASILLISPRTVETHIQNILLKIGGHSQEAIIDFIEKSPEFAFVKKHYLDLLVKTVFEQQLKRIFYLAKKCKVSCFIRYNNRLDLKVYTLQSLIKHLKMTNIEVITDINNTTKVGTDTNYICNLQVIGPNNIEQTFENAQFKEKQNNIFLIIDSTTNKLRAEISLYKDIESQIIDLSTQDQYFFSVFKILEKLLVNIDCSKFIDEFEQLRSNIIKTKTDITTELVKVRDYTIETIEEVTKKGSLDQTREFLSKVILVIFNKLSIIVFITGSISLVTWHLITNNYLIENKYKLVEAKINQFAEDLNTDQTSVERAQANRLDILSVQQAVDDLYNKYQNHLSQADLQSKFNYLSCVLAGHYRYNEEYADVLVDNYLKEKYLSFWQKVNSNLKELHNYVAFQILHRVEKHYNTRYGLTDNDTMEAIKDKLVNEPYAFEDYILLHYYLSRGYMSYSIKNWRNEDKIRTFERYLDIAFLGKEYNMYEACAAEKNKLIFERDKIKISIMKLTKKLKDTFPIIRDETSLVSIIEKIKSEKHDEQKLKKIIESFLRMHQGKELQLKEIIDSFFRLESDEHKYINHYKPWKKIQEEYLVPKNVLFNSVVMCKENLYTQAVFMNYYTLLYYDNPKKLQQEHRRVLSNSLQALNQFLGHREINDKWVDSAIKAQKKKIIIAIKDLGEGYYDNNISTQLQMITDLIQENQFYSSIRSKVNSIIEMINRQNL